MPTLLESVSTLLDEGNAMEQLGSSIGRDNRKTKTVVDTVAPALLGAAAEKASGKGGASSVLGMLEDDDGLVVNDVGDFFSKGSPNKGNRLLDGLLGKNRGEFITDLATRSGVGGDVIGKALPMLAPVVMGVVGQQRSERNLDADGLTNLLSTERSKLERAGLLSGVGVAAAAGSDSLGVNGDHLSVSGNGGKKASKKGKAAAAGVAAGVAGVGAAAGAGKVGAAPVKEKATAGVSTGDGDNRGGFGWVAWAIGAMALVLLLAWLLSRCNDTTEVEGGDAPATTATTADDATATTAAATGLLQSDVDAALQGTEVSGIVDGDTVTLTGTVPIEGDKLLAEERVAALPGAVNIVNNIEVEGDAMPDSGTTINEALSLDPITFDVNSDVITPEGQAVLDQAAGYLEENAAVRVEIAGHTDSDGANESNLDLSQRRAESVKRYLEGKGIDGGRMEPKGYGEESPVVANDTPANKAINRRIEFRIL